MGFFYFDESTHPCAKFNLGAFVYSELDLHDHVADALVKSGLTPQVDEFKSGNRMIQNPRQILAREKLRAVVHQHCRIAVVIAPHEPRYSLGSEALTCLEKVVQKNEFQSNQHQVFLDEGLFRKAEKYENMITGTLKQTCTFCFEQNSKYVIGVQVADLVAHTCAKMLLAELGILRKSVKAGENSGYDPNLDIDLGFELWAGIRHKFFAAAPPPPQEWKSQLDFQVDVESRGLHVAQDCDSQVKAAALSRFGKMYLGCVH